MGKTLFEISDDLRALETILFESGGEISDEEMERTLDDWFAEIGVERDKKLDGYASLIREIELRAEIRKSESKRLAERAQSDLGNADRLKGRLKYFFERHNLKKVETDRFTLSLVNNGGKVPMKLKCLPQELPEEFQKVEVVTTVKADTETIRALLESGQSLEFAELGERGTSLRIK